MKVQQRIEAINQVLSHFGMRIWSPNRRFYKVESLEWPNLFDPYFRVAFHANAPELTIEKVRAECMRSHNKTLEDVAAEVAAKVEEMRPIREENERREAENKRAYNEANENVPVSEYLRRVEAVWNLAKASDAERLEFYRQLCAESRAIVSDDDEDFLKMTADSEVLAIAFELVRHRTPKLLVSERLKYRRGAVKSAVQYLVSKAS